MRKLCLIIICVIQLVFLSSGIVFAKTLGTTSGRILNLSIGARQVGMGDTFVGIADDVNTIHWNPGGLGRITDRAVSAMHMNSVLDMYYGHVGFVLPARNRTIGISLTTFQGGDLDIMYLDGTSKTVNAQQDYVVTFSYGTKILTKVNIGANIKMLQSTLAEDYKATAYAGDVGILIPGKDEIVMLGIVIQNIGTGFKYDKVSENLPAKFRMGLGSKFDLQKIHKFIVGVDVVVIFNEHEKVNTGFEYTYKDLISLRGGYKFKERTFATGLGFNFRNYQLDYAFGMLGEMDEDETHTVSFGMKF